MARESCSPNTAILELLLMTLQTQPFLAILPNLRTMGRAITSKPIATQYFPIAHKQLL
jgi:hypothetical protein